MPWRHLEKNYTFVSISGLQTPSCSNSYASGNGITFLGAGGGNKEDKALITDILQDDVEKRR